MSPADDALVVLFEAAVSSSDLITFAQFVLRAAVALAARVEALDVLLLEPLVGIAVIVPMIKSMNRHDGRSSIFSTRNTRLTSTVPSEWILTTFPG